MEFGSTHLDGEEKIGLSMVSGVDPSVWISLARDPDQRIEILLTDAMLGGAHKLYGTLSYRLSHELKNAQPILPLEAIGSPVRLVPADRVVLVILNLREFLRVALPLTAWWAAQDGLARRYKALRSELSRAIESIDPDDAKHFQLDPTIELYRQSERHLVGAPIVPASERGILKAAFLNRPVQLAIYHSRRALKADAAINVFDLSCKKITWAIVDSGIDATHPAFYKRKPDGAPEEAGADGFVPSRVARTYDLTRLRVLLDKRADPPEELAKQFTDHEWKDFHKSLQQGQSLRWDLLEPWLRVRHDETYAEESVPQIDHGTNIAGIVGANWPEYDDSTGHGLIGLCPDIELYDIRVFDSEAFGDEFDAIRALQFIRYLNADKDWKVVDGVNVGLSVWWDFHNYPCGGTPVCEESERLVSSGAVVVAPAGNRGMNQASKEFEATAIAMGITDPGNAASVITVGSTHRMRTNTYGISYFSSRGPTVDGRPKPDLVAPGERILTTSKGADHTRVEGTSMAAAHVSGAAALLLARHQELIGDPQKVKEILCETATDLGRDRYFQGAGMVDVMRALQML